jgi:hypothetical protein
MGEREWGLGMTPEEALDRARREYRRAQKEPDLHARFRAYLSAGMNILDAAMNDPENPKVKNAMTALLKGAPNESEDNE